jgi:hypothetical protein
MSVLLEVFLPEDIGSVLDVMRSNPWVSGRTKTSSQRYGHGNFPPGGKRRLPGQPGPKVEDDPKKMGEMGEAYDARSGIYIIMKMSGGYATWYVNDSNDKFETLGDPNEIRTRSDAMNVMRIHHDKQMAGL